MSEVREKLRPLVGKRIQVRGVLVRFGEWIRNYRDVGRACVSLPEQDGEVLAEHVWVVDVPHWLKHKCNLGEQVSFTAVVKPYQDKGGTTNYCLTSADELIFVHNPPALAIPDPPEEDVPPPEQQDADPPEFPERETQACPLEAMRQVKQFAKECGGLELAERMVIALERVAMPLPVLTAWLRALREE